MNELVLSGKATGGSLGSDLLCATVLPVVKAAVTVSAGYGLRRMKRYVASCRTMKVTDDVSLLSDAPTSVFVERTMEGTVLTDENEPEETSRETPPLYIAVKDENSTAQGTVSDSTRTQSIGDSVSTSPLSPQSHDEQCKNEIEGDSINFVVTASKQGDVDTFSYLEHCSLILVKKAEGADHLDRIGIGEALFELGEIAYNRKKFGIAKRILERAVAVQRRVVRESIFFIAAAMREHGQVLMVQGKQSTAHVYLKLSRRLKEHQNEDEVDFAWKRHDEIRRMNNIANVDDDVSDKLQRRLKRARNEHLPLAHTLRMLKDCEEKLEHSSQNSK